MKKLSIDAPRRRSARVRLREPRPRRPGPQLAGRRRNRPRPKRRRPIPPAKAEAPRRRGRGQEGRRAGAGAAADAPKPPNINKGDTAFMYVATMHGHPDDDPRPGAVLRRPGALEEHAVGADAGVRGLRADQRAVGRSTATRWRSPAATPFFGGLSQDVAVGRERRVRGGHVQQGHLHPRAAVRRVPVHVRGHHLRPDRRRATPSA